LPNGQVRHGDLVPPWGHRLSSQNQIRESPLPRPTRSAILLCPLNPRIAPPTSIINAGARTTRCRFFNSRLNALIAPEASRRVTVSPAGKCCECHIQAVC
jgi:hypothetical protein